ncbi:DUF6438 domain-containing protein [Sphingomonas sp.]|uniref:DUF6438 domain-containing protein n=1 Tax=Sphingomonas sp. TaxID=28214 RepID=UPI003D6CE2C6
MRMTIVVGALLIAGCATPQRQSATLQTITYETAPCYGVCPVYRVTVGSDGAGIFTGIRHTAIGGDRKFSVTPRQFTAFAGTLSPYRPQGKRDITPGRPECNDTVTDMPSVNVRWEDVRTDELSYYYGCRPASGPAMADALTTAPSLLPIADFIGKR